MYHPKRMRSAGIAATVVCGTFFGMTLPTGDTAWAQADYPSKNVTFIVPFAAGGATDNLSRVVAEALAHELGARIIVENRPGASNQIGVQHVLTQPADGYTVLVGTVGLAVLRLVNKAFDLDLRKELQGVALLGSSPLVLAIGSKLPVQNIQQFVDFARKKPGHLNYGSQGAIDVLASSALASALDINTTTIRYGGGNFVKAALLSNDIHFSIFYSGDVAPLVSADKVRLIATTGKERHREYPHLPTIAEVSKTDYEYVGWAGLFVRTGTPEAIVSKLNAAVLRTMERSDFRKRLLELGYEAHQTKPQEFSRYLADEIEKWSAIALKTEFKPE